MYRLLLLTLLAFTFFACTPETPVPEGEPEEEKLDYGLIEGDWSDYDTGEHVWSFDSEGYFENGRGEAVCHVEGTVVSGKWIYIYDPERGITDFQRPLGWFPTFFWEKWEMTCITEFSDLDTYMILTEDGNSNKYTRR